MLLAGLFVTIFFLLSSLHNHYRWPPGYIFPAVEQRQGKHAQERKDYRSGRALES